VYCYCRNILTSINTVIYLIAFSALYRDYWLYVVLVFFYPVVTGWGHASMDLQAITGLLSVVRTSGGRWMNIESRSPVRRHDALSTTNLTYACFSATESRPSLCDINVWPNELWYSLLVFTHFKQKFKLHAQESWLTLQLITCTSVLLDTFYCIIGRQSSVVFKEIKLVKGCRLALMSWKLWTTFVVKSKRFPHALYKQMVLLQFSL
jgi:hypothetical protein